MKRIALLVLGFALLLTGCTGQDVNPSSDQRVAPNAISPIDPEPGLPPSPSKHADCNEKDPPAGSIPVEGGGSIPIHHTTMICGAPFEDYVDLTSMANGLPGCKNVPARTNPDLGRPCDYPLRREPNWRSAAYTKDEVPWSPVEGQFLANGEVNPPLHIRCQVIGGVTTDDRGIGSNIWNLVDDRRLKGKIGYLPDTVTSPNHDGGRGWRNIPCTVDQLQP